MQNMPLHRLMNILHMFCIFIVYFFLHIEHIFCIFFPYNLHIRMFTACVMHIYICILDACFELIYAYSVHIICIFAMLKSMLWHILCIFWHANAY